MTLIKTYIPRVLTSVSDSNIQSNNNSATPEDIFNQDNANKLAENPTFALKNILLPDHLHCMANPKHPAERIK